MPENVVIVGSGPAAWTAAIYAARANLNPLVFQGNPYDDRNRQNGTLPLGQLALTTEVENFPSWPAGDTRQYLKTALKPDDPDFPYWVADDKPGVTAVRVRNNKPGAREHIPASGLFLAIGHTPNVGFLGGQVELTPTGYIKWTTLGRTYTSVPGVFAAGDVADDYYKQAVSAAGTGCMAALDAERYLGHHGLV